MNADFIIIGAGIVGLTVAYELRKQYPHAKIIVIEKEKHTGMHSSGRNSGVLHSGIYYPTDSLKAKICASGATLMAEFCLEHKLAYSKIGKVILPLQKNDDALLDTLLQRALANGAHAKIVNQHELTEIEPEAVSLSGRALHSPGTAVVDPKEVLEKLMKVLLEQEVEIFFDCKLLSVDEKNKSIETTTGTISFGHFFNAAGLHADQVAHAFGVGRDFVIMPFKGRYYEITQPLPFEIRGLIYPVPDINIPFLGVHFTKSVHGLCHLGPTATPALGRENYDFFKGSDWESIPGFGLKLLKMYFQKKQNIRGLIHVEFKRLFKQRFVEESQKMVPRMKAEYIQPSKKVGIRAQLFDVKNQTLMMDFFIDQGRASTHVLNAVSPGFTSSFSFAKEVVRSSKI